MGRSSGEIDPSGHRAPQLLPTRGKRLAEWQKQGPYYIREVDALDDDVRFQLECLHSITLGGCPSPDYDKGFWWLAYCATAPVGFAGLVPSANWQETGYLCRAGVAPEHRGHGLQLRLIKVREAKARKLGWSTLVVDTCDALASSNNLIKAGYRLYEPKRPWSFQNALYWRKQI